MMTSVKIQGERLHLRALSPEDVTQSYLDWMRDPKVNRYLESRFSRHTLESLRSFVIAMNESPDNYLFGVFLEPRGEHIGNIKIGSISQHHRHADVGLIIGAKTAWGMGYGTEAIRLVTRHAFDHLGLNKLYAGMYAENAGSARAFLKAGYREIGVLKKHVLCDGRFIDSLMVEICRDDGGADGCSAQLTNRPSDLKNLI